nr:L-ribulose-5-phosphate 4-epimerase AraD [uncultured Sphaerochaeta sp.]
MKLDDLKQSVYLANLELVERKLVISTWGNVSGFDPENNLMVIKASGIPYSRLSVEDMVVVDLDGNVLDSKKRPSTDTPTHLYLYKHFAKNGILGIVHTHSQYATMWAQSGKPIPCYGTTHGDYFYGEVPCTRMMTKEEVTSKYEENTGKVIIEAMESTDCIHTSATLVRSHAPFVWGKTPQEAVLHSEVLEYIAKMAFCNVLLTPNISSIDQQLADKHYLRKFGPGAYYGQN